MKRWKLQVFIGIIILFLTLFIFSFGFLQGQTQLILTSTSPGDKLSFTSTHLPSETKISFVELASSTEIPTLAILLPKPNSEELHSTQEGEPQAEYVADQVLVKFEESISTEQLDKYLITINGSIISQIPELGVSVLSVPIGQAGKVNNEINSCSCAVFAELNYIVSATDFIPNDPDWLNQYDLVAINAPQGWTLTTGANSVTIAILDTGVDLSHPDLFTKILPGYDFVNNDAFAQDDHGHGTHVAGIAAALINNGIGIAGVDGGASILPVKVLDAYGNGSYSNVAAGIIWATNNGAQVINLSLGGAKPSFVLEDAINYAHERNVILVGASGNSGVGTVLYPAAYPFVIAVAASNSTNKWASFSNYGPEVDVTAPGVMIYSAYPGGGYGYRSGTSMAAPHVSGLAAILMGIPGIDPVLVQSIIESSSLDLGDNGWDEYYGYGLIQMDAAIQLAWPKSTPTLSPTFTPTITPNVLQLPDSGFIPNHNTILPVQPADKTYADMGDLWLEIPRLEVNLPIIGVPQTESGWDVSWLGDQAGWLNGTAFPTHAGNSVLTAHVYNNRGKPGPFVNLSKLQWGDQIIIHAYGQEYVYEVQESELVAPQNVSSVISHEEYPWLTLITCGDYDINSNSYRYRVVVRAVQMTIK